MTQRNNGKAGGQGFLLTPWGAHEAVCPESARAGELSKESHKGGTLELPLKKCLAIHQTEEGIPEKQKGLCHGKDSRKTCHICIKWLITGVAAGGMWCVEGREEWLERPSLPNGRKDARSGQAMEDRSFKQDGDQSKA